MTQVFRKEASPDPIRTPNARTAKVAHLVTKGKVRSLCGVSPKYGWQVAATTLPTCPKCKKYGDSALQAGRNA